LNHFFVALTGDVPAIQAFSSMVRKKTWMPAKTGLPAVWRRAGMTAARDSIWSESALTAHLAKPEVKKRARFRLTPDAQLQTS
jgi:hypothetical protein